MEITKYLGDDLLQKIKDDFFEFSADELINYTKLIIPNIHLFLCAGQKERLKRYCTDELICKMLENKDAYRVTPDIDVARVQYARIDDYKNEKNEIFITVYTSVFFYDNISNNEEIDYEMEFDKYWNDIWSVTFKGDFGKDIVNNCPFCKNQMQYNHKKNMYTCENCKDSVYYSKLNWKIADIEVNKVKYTEEV